MEKQSLTPEENPGEQRPPAFPSKFRIVKKHKLTGKTMVHDILNLGLTKREFFAAMALQGSLNSDQPGYERTGPEHIKFAIQCADRLIKELGQTDKMEEKQYDTETG